MRPTCAVYETLHEPDLEVARDESVEAVRKVSAEASTVLRKVSEVSSLATVATTARLATVGRRHGSGDF